MRKPRVEGASNFSRARRNVLLGAAGLAVAGCAKPSSRPAAAVARSSRDRQLHRMLSRWFDEDLRDAPENATELGLDVGELLPLRGRLPDLSASAISGRRARAARRLADLRSLGTSDLSEESVLSHEVAAYGEGLHVDRGSFPYGGRGPYPYPVTQLTGNYFWVPSLLENQHPIETKADADFYLSRLEAFGRVLSQEADLILRDAANGTTPPNFIIDRTISNLKKLRPSRPEESTLVTSLARRARDKGLPDYTQAAVRIVGEGVSAAIDRQIAALEQARKQASDRAGVWHLRDGERYYAHTLRFATTTNYSPDEVHRIGLEQVADLQSRLDQLLIAQGYTKGSVGERLNGMGREDRFLFPNTDKGRADLLERLRSYAAGIEPLLPRVFSTLPRSKVEIRRKPPAIEAGATGGSYEAPTLDGSRPGAFTINLRDTSEMPIFVLPTTTYHETVPGHHLQVALALEAGELPIYRRAVDFTAFSEGWALYAERVADELGVYENDPFGRIGFLQRYLYRAARLVLDTGIHQKRWGREQAIPWMVENAAVGETWAAREIERYAVRPGQACAYKIGESVFSRIRSETEERLGPSFDIKLFHDTVLLGGAMPLSVLEQRVRKKMVQAQA